ncbi:MAG: hypothetical protein JWR21_931 [Herminiimonas sp.]|nr:hypothetical protein [Herminiimonas sp.]
MTTAEQAPQPSEQKADDKLFAIVLALARSGIAHGCGLPHDQPSNGYVQQMRRLAASEALSARQRERIAYLVEWYEKGRPRSDETVVASAAPAPQGEPPTADAWLDQQQAVASKSWCSGWDACRSWVKEFRTIALATQGPQGEPANEQFTKWFAANYPGPDTIIHDPLWHAPRILRAASAALATQGKAAPTDRQAFTAEEMQRMASGWGKAAPELEIIEAPSMEKECRQCSRKKPLSDFQKDKRMRDGYLNQCKECRKQRAMAPDSVAARLASSRSPERQAAKKAYAKSPDGREVRLAYVKRNSHKVQAKQAVNHAVQAGKMTRPDRCSVCDKLCRPHGHHDNYLKPLSVRWLCAKCHREYHGAIDVQAGEKS